MTRHGTFPPALSGRALRRSLMRDLMVKRVERDHLIAVTRSEDATRDEKRMARLWMRFPDTREGNLLGRVNAWQKRRAKNKVARASRKANR
jgi:hypothetical protein